MKGECVFVIVTRTIKTDLHRNIICIYANENDAKDYVKSHEKLLKSEGIAIYYFGAILK